MNGKAARRIRVAARILRTEGTLKRLKKEYLALPYHRRKKGDIKMESHKEIYTRYHQP